MKPIKAILFISAMLFAALFSSCGNKHNSQTEANMPKFEPKFPQKSVWIHYNNSNDSIEITFSSMEEAEWKLIHDVKQHDFCEAFEKVVLSDPSSMDYPFDSLFQNENFCELCLPVRSDDGNVRCFGIYPHTAHEIPKMMTFYKKNDKLYKAEKSERAEDCYYCLRPDTIYTFNTDKSTIYLVWGYCGYTGEGNGFKLSAYELDNTGLHPASVFEDGDGQSLYTQICTNDEMYDELAKDHFRLLIYFDKNESAIYARVLAESDKGKSGCSTKVTNRYEKYVWNGKKFVFKK